MPQSLQDRVRAALAGLRLPGAASDIVESGALSDIYVDGAKVMASITVPADAAERLEPLAEEAEKRIRAVEGVERAYVSLTAEAAPGTSHSAPPKASAAPKGAQGASGTPKGAQGHGLPPRPELPGVKSIVAVASGKGGVGKSTTAVNLALGLAAEGLKVGILDADVYGPSVPKLLGITGQPAMEDSKFIPMEAYGLKVMSIGFLVDEETPLIWRGPMAVSALTQMMRESKWGQLDVMVVDMPPGTGDVQLSMAQQAPLAGAVVVSTPQDLALLDARRGIAMFEKVEVPIFGLVENMSYFICPHCGGRSDIFGHGGAAEEAKRLGVPFLGEIPLELAIRETSDAGKPVVATLPDGPHAAAYRAIAQRIAAALAAGAGPRAMPKIVIE